MPNVSMHVTLIIVRGSLDAEVIIATKDVSSALGAQMKAGFELAQYLKLDAGSKEFLDILALVVADDYPDFIFKTLEIRG